VPQPLMTALRFQALVADDTGCALRDRNSVSVFRFTMPMSAHRHLSSSTTLPRRGLAHEERPWFRRPPKDVRRLTVGLSLPGALLPGALQWRVRPARLLEPVRQPRPDTSPS